jgi:hypothetical protein
MGLRKLKNVLFRSMGIIKAWQCFSPDVTVNGFKKCCTSNTVDESDMLRNCSEEERNIRNENEAMKGMTVKMETVTLTGKGRYNPTCFVYQV